jgi:hypothetical protein
MRWSISRRIFQIRSLKRSHSTSWLASYAWRSSPCRFLRHVVNEALDSWIVMYTGRDNKVNVEMESDYSYKIAVDIHEAIKAYGMCIFDFESSSMWMIQWLKMMLITSHHNRRECADRNLSWFRHVTVSYGFQHTADNHHQRAFYASVNGINLFQNRSRQCQYRKITVVHCLMWKMLVIKESSIVNFLNRNGSNCTHTCPHDQDGYARKICGRFSHYNCRWGNVGSQMISTLTSETPDRILFRPVCQLSDYFPSSVRRIQRTVCRKGSDSLRPRLGDILTCTDFFADPRSHPIERFDRHVQSFHFDATYWYIKQPFVLSWSFWMLLKHARSSLSLHNASRVVARNHRPSYRSMI